MCGTRSPEHLFYSNFLHRTVFTMWSKGLWPSGNTRNTIKQTMVSFSVPLIFCSYRFSCLIKDSIVSSCSHNFSFPHFSIICHFFSCVSILWVLANSYQNVVSIISILHLFCGHKHNLYRVNKKRPHNCKILRKMRAPVVRGKRKTSQFLRKHCCFLNCSSLGGRHTFVTCKTIHFPFGPRKYMKN